MVKSKCPGSIFLCFQIIIILYYHSKPLLSPSLKLLPLLPPSYVRRPSRALNSRKSNKGLKRKKILPCLMSGLTFHLFPIMLPRRVLESHLFPLFIWKKTQIRGWVENYLFQQSSPDLVQIHEVVQNKG